MTGELQYVAQCFLSSVMDLQPALPRAVFTFQTC